MSTRESPMAGIAHNDYDSEVVPITLVLPVSSVWQVPHTQSVTEQGLGLLLDSCTFANRPKDLVQHYLCTV